MKKGILIFLIFFLIIATTLTKNATKKIDQKIFEKRENIILLKNKYELVLLDYNYLSSPKKLMDFQSQYFENYLIPFNINILSDLYQFILLIQDLLRSIVQVLFLLKNYQSIRIYLFLFQIYLMIPKWNYVR